MPTLSELEAGIASASKLLVDLQQARVAFILKRNATCLWDFDVGVSRQTICETREITYSALNAILHKNKRRMADRSVSGLSLKQRQHFSALVRSGCSPKAARKIALSLGVPAIPLGTPADGIPPQTVSIPVAPVPLVAAGRDSTEPA